MSVLRNGSEFEPKRCYKRGVIKELRLTDVSVVAKIMKSNSEAFLALWV